MRWIFPEPVTVRGQLFCAAEAKTLTPRIVVEAESLEQAARRLKAVADWFPVVRGENLVVTTFDGATGGLPTFLDGFFQTWKGAEHEPAGNRSEEMKQ